MWGATLCSYLPVQKGRPSFTRMPARLAQSSRPQRSPIRRTFKEDVLKESIMHLLDVEVNRPCCDTHSAYLALTYPFCISELLTYRLYQSARRSISPFTLVEKLQHFTYSVLMLALSLLLTLPLDLQSFWEAGLGYSTRLHNTFLARNIL